ncbi:hypothetical protein CFK37_02470 [Virgibacillus phasianinus]|uniref:DUF2785 domain-containing protein n=1 Tax=Virgibacillus phasianinus TaxID=2017483 RepID=A0A220TZN4_9BACI|nr:DUF2785 domain-containing protein [Virgibacillus phasianinus]ASK61136.1 hypothetical protein CFK37_02470 [Virgibacillus phasianinus]
MNTTGLRKILTTYKNNDYQIDKSLDMSELTAAMLREIGNVDPVLRDELIYLSFAQLIISDTYSDEILNELHHTCLDQNHLFYKIGETDTDSVFTRSFSSLIIAVLLHVNLEKGFLTEVEIADTSTLLVKYLSQEQDVRGMVPNKGWAHSVAHIADAIDELIKQPSLPTVNLEVIFHALLSKMAFHKEHFLYDEEERMAIPIVTMLQRGFDESIICEKVIKLTDDLKQDVSADNQSYYIYRANVKQFLSSLFFHLEMTEQARDVRDSIKQGLFQMNQPYYQM